MNSATACTRAEIKRRSTAYVDTPPEVCAQRDPKGLYARARAGELRNFTGVDAPYEPPESPELVISGSGCSVGEGAARVLGALGTLARVRRGAAGAL